MAATLEHTDGFQIRVDFGVHPAMPETTSETWTLSALQGPPPWTTEQVREELLTLPRSRREEGDTNFTLDIRANDFSWGAASTSTEFLMFLAQSAAAATTYEALRAVALRMATAIREHNAERYPAPIPATLDEARQSAVWAVQIRRNRGEPGELALITASMDSENNYTFIFGAPEGTEYEVLVETVEDVIQLTRIKKMTFSNAR